MDLENKLIFLYENDSTSNYKYLLELEEISEKEDTLYKYFDIFLSMIDSETNIIRIRGFRLISKLAKWDKENKFDSVIDYILLNVNDEKPTSVRQKLMCLKDIIKYKSKFNSKVKECILKINYSNFKDTMQPLIEKDIQELINIIDSK